MNSKHILIVTGLLCYSCSTHSHKINDPVEKTEISTDQYIPAKVYENISCLNNAEYSYSLYLPASYKSDESYPIILFYDAHARGSLPVKKYQAVADKYRLILAGLNNSENRQTQTFTTQLTNTVLADLKERFSVNSHSVIAAGFSGGARIATGLALSRLDFFGAIACGAANPGQINIVNTSACLAAIAGDEDFNFLEMHEFYEQLNSMHIPNRLFEFRGEHDWPSMDIFDKATQYILLEAYRKNAMPPNNKFISKLFKTDKDEFENYFELKRYDSAWYYYLLINEYYAGLEDLTSFQKKYKQKITSEYQEVPGKYREEIFAKEKELQTYYLPKLGEKPIGWWEAEVKKMNGYKMLSSNIHVIKMYSRVLNYLSLASNIKAGNAISDKNPEQAGYFLQIYEWVDRDNADVFFLKALNSALKNNDGEVQINLEKAVGLGYTDKDRLQTEPLLRDFQAEKWFKNLIEKIKE